jgi:hypothetical protein
MSSEINVMIMEARDELLVTFDQNPAVAEASKTWKVGDKVNPKAVKLRVKAINGDSVLFTVDAIIPDGFKEVEEANINVPIASPSTPVPSLDAMSVERTT